MAKKELNKNIVVALTLLAFLIMIFASVVMLRQLQSRDPKYYTDLAQEYDRHGDWQTAALFYKEAWERSNDAVHLVGQGESLLKDGAVGDALRSWRTALINQPDLIEAHMRQLEVLLELGRLYGRMANWEDVQEAAETFLDTDVEKTPIQAAFAHHANGLALLNLARRDPAGADRGEAELREAVKLDGEAVDYALDLGSYLIRQERIEEGERLYRELTERFASPGAEASKARLAYAEYLASRERLDEAERSFKASLTMAEHAPAALRDTKLAYAMFLSQRWARAARDDPDDESTQALFNEAEATLEQCANAYPDDFEPYQYLATLYKLAGRYQDVIDVCEARLQRGFSREGIEGPRNRINMFGLMIQASEACVAEAVTAHRNGDHERRESFLVRAEQYVTDARGEFPSHPGLLSQQGRVKLARGLDRQALEDFRAADEAYRSYDAINWENKLILARVHLKLNEAGAAKAVLDEALEAARRDRPRDVNFWTLYAQVLFQNNDLDRALSVADQILGSDSDNADALRIKAAVFERKNRPQDAGRFVEDRTVRAILTARQFALEGDMEAAVAALHEALVEDPANPRLVSAAVRELHSLDRADEARAIVDAALAIRPDDVQLQGLALATREDLTDEQRDQAVLDIIETQEDAYERTLALIGFHVRNKDTRTALGLVDEALEHLITRDTPAAQNATTAQHRALLKTKLSLASTLDDAEALEAAREAAERYNVDGAGGQSILGLYHVYRKEYELAVTAFRRAVDAQPTDARSLTYLGQCLQILGRTADARASYERAIQINPNDGDAHKSLAILARAEDDTEAFEEAFATCERLIPNDPWVRAEVVARREQAEPHAAIARREKLLAENPDDTENLRRLAALCEVVDDLPKADAYYQRLVELQPDDKDLMVAVSKYYRRTGRPERSLDLISRYAASRLNPKEKANASILVAAHYLGVGEVDAVERTLLAAADIAETFEVAQSLAEFYIRGLDQPDKALPWLDKCVAHARADEPSELPRILAARVTCLLHQKLNDVEAAKRGVEELRATFPDYSRGLLLASDVHARMGEIEKAVGFLSDYLVGKPNDPGALYQRALHRRAQGRTAAAIEDLETIKRTNPLAIGLEPRFLLARLHQQAGRPDLSLREVESIARDAPDSPAALHELATAYMQQERWADAERVVAAEINRAGDKPDPRWFFLRGRIALAQGDATKALADFQRGAEVSGYTAEAVTSCLDLYVQLGRPGEGVQYYQRYAPTQRPTPALLSRYALSLSRTGRSAQAVEQFRRAMDLAIRDSSAARLSVTTDLRAAWPVDEAVSLFTDSEPGEALVRPNDMVLSRLYWMDEQYDQAEVHLNRLIETCADDRERGNLLQDLGDLCQVAGHPVRAREAYEKSLQFNADNWIVLNNLAYVLSDTLNEHEQARTYAQRAVALADNPATLDTLGWIHVGLGEYALAIADLNRAIRLRPDDPLTYYHLGEAYRRDGRFDKAGTILTSGRDLARAAGRDALVAQIEASLERVERTDRTP